MLSEVLRAGHEPTAGLSHLRIPDSILMSYGNPDNRLKSPRMATRSQHGFHRHAHAAACHARMVRILLRF
jgi:hypothetical protein